MAQEKSNLFLVKSHHSFNDEGIEFKTEMLAWPIYQSEDDEKIIEEKYQKVIKDALFAMTELAPFTIKISLGVDEINKRLFDVKRIWGNIYLKDKVVVPFTRDTRYDNAPFVSLFDWVEMMNFASSPQYEGHDNEFQKVIDWSSRGNWKQFFKNRIAQSYSTLMGNAIDEMEKAAWNAKIALIIKSCLENVV